MNVGSSGSGLALFCATRINIRLYAIPAVGKLWVQRSDMDPEALIIITYNSICYRERQKVNVKEGSEE